VLLLLGLLCSCPVLSCGWLLVDPEYCTYAIMIYLVVVRLLIGYGEEGGRVVVLICRLVLECYRY
jgi:hypothetical protein